MDFYSARLSMIVLVDDGRPRKMHTWDESVVVFRAKDLDHAFARALEIGRSHETEYLNDREQKVRWALVEVENVDRVGKRVDGSEVASRFQARAFEAGQRAGADGETSSQDPLPVLMPLVTMTVCELQVGAGHRRDGSRGHPTHRGRRLVSGSPAVQPSAVQASNQAGASDGGRPPAGGAGTQDTKEHPPTSGAIAMKYLIILEPTETGFSAYSPDLDGCVAAAGGRAETIALMQEAITFHLEGLATEGLPVPTPHSEATMVEVHT